MCGDSVFVTPCNATPDVGIFAFGEALASIHASTVADRGEVERKRRENRIPTPGKGDPRRTITRYSARYSTRYSTTAMAMASPGCMRLNR